MQPNIYMFHRIEMDPKHPIAEVYYRRGMAHKIIELYELIDRLLKEGKKWGSIKQCTSNNDYFHFSFDDGYKEHLVVAHNLKQRYSLESKDVTFSINIGNSYKKDYTGMDIVYAAMDGNNLHILNSLLDICTSEKDIKIVKQNLIKQPPGVLKEILKIVPGVQALSFLFLEQEEVKELSKIFDIACHGITHRDMTNHTMESKVEIKLAKKNLKKS